MNKLELAFSRQLRSNMPLFEMWSTEEVNCKSLPDIHFQCKSSGISGWLEVKYIRPNDKTLKYQKGQPRWLTNYANRGGNSFVIATDESKMIYLLKGERAFSTQFMKVEEIPWDGKHANRDWPGLTNHLRLLISSSKA